SRTKYGQMTLFGWLSCYHHKSLRPGCQPPGQKFPPKDPCATGTGPARTAQTVKKVPSSRHVRMDGTHTGKFVAEKVRSAMRRVGGSAPNFVPRGIQGGRNFFPAYAGRNGFPLERGAFATR